MTLPSFTGRYENILEITLAYSIHGEKGYTNIEIVVEDPTIDGLRNLRESYLEKNVSRFSQRWNPICDGRLRVG